MITCLCVPEVSGKVITLLSKLDSDNFMHLLATSKVFQ